LISSRQFFFDIDATRVFRAVYINGSFDGSSARFYSITRNGKRDIKGFKNEDVIHVSVERRSVIIEQKHRSWVELNIIIIIISVA